MLTVWEDHLRIWLAGGSSISQHYTVARIMNTTLVSWGERNLMTSGTPMFRVVLICHYQPRVLKSDFLKLQVDLPLQIISPDQLSIHVVRVCALCTPPFMGKPGVDGWRGRKHLFTACRYCNGKAVITACKCWRKHTCNMYCSNSSTRVTCRLD